jgi:single-stranded-DNA-specific exonuclease
VATVADVVPIRGANRAIVQFGLENLSKSPGLEALRKVARLPYEVMARDLAFEIAPRINAAGRLRDARLSLKLLLTDDPLEATLGAETLNAINEERKLKADKYTAEARAMVADDVLYPEELRAIVIKNEKWEHGIVGLVASKLAETFCRPVYVGGFSPADGLIHGSARTGAVSASGDPVSCAEIMDKARVGEFGDLLCSGGGHEAAAGFTVAPEQWGQFRTNLENQANQAMTGVAISRPIMIDVPWELPSDGEIMDLLSFEPTGKGFEAPLLGTLGVEVLGAGKGRRERIWQVCKAGRQLDMVGYQGVLDPPEGCLIDIAYYVERSKRGKLRLRLEGWRESLA